jgi:GNAT superfamily N-acetyltransferase
MTPLEQFSWEARLKSGAVARIRPLGPGDRERMAQAIRGLEAQSIYTRLFGHRKGLTEAGLDRVMHTDPVREVVLVATLPAPKGEVIIGAGRYVAPAAPAPLHSADVAFVVEEDYHGQGLASALLRHLVEVARDRGFACLEADVLAENPSMLKVFARAGLPLRRRHEGGSLHLWLDLAAS